MSDRLTRAAAALLALLALGACSKPSVDPLVKDPAQWPLAKLKGLTDHPKLPDEADRALAQIKVGSYNLTAWINSSGVCGLSSSDWSMYFDLTGSEGVVNREEGFSGPTEPAATNVWNDKTSLSCTPTRMLIRVEGATSHPSVSGDAVAQPVKGGLNAVVGSPEAQRESLPGATVTPGR